MAEDVNRPSRTTFQSQTAPESAGTDQREGTLDGKRDQRRQPVVTTPSEDTAEELLKTKRPLQKRPLVLAVAAGLLVVGVLFGVPYYNYAVSHEWTDDAFIEGRIIQISSKVAGHVARVYVNDNQEVKQGDLLVEIDAREYAARLVQAQATLQAARARQQAAQAAAALTHITADAGVQQASSGVDLTEAAVETARAQVATAHSRFEQARAQVETAQAHAAEARAQILAAEAEAIRAEADVKRLQELARRDQISRQELDQAIATARTANAQFEAARKKASAGEAQVAEARAAQRTAAESLRQAESQVSEAQARIGEARGRLAAAGAAPHQVAVSRAQVELANAEVEQARAAIAQAQLDLSSTRISAPESGRVTRGSIEAGAYAHVGQGLMAIVPADVWVVANFMETQLTDMRPGQPVEITVDAYPAKRLRGHVDSIQAGTGARFSLLPPENATGNFVKVVQRVPVKIVFDASPSLDHLLSPGMSVVPVVKVK
ncbi:MAG TPA: HlyD family secretion protein [Candidatus Tectomicrobia bacterium]|nr:HlyD family secretion protein [Candidatus Tectomicrobia bacterium]